MPYIWLFDVPFVIVENTDEVIPRNKRLREFYDKKGKKVAVIACANKLLHWLYAPLQNN